MANILAVVLIAGRACINLSKKKTQVFHTSSCPILLWVHKQVNDLSQLKGETQATFSLSPFTEDNGCFSLGSICFDNIWTWDRLK